MKNLSRPDRRSCTHCNMRIIRKIILATSTFPSKEMFSIWYSFRSKNPRGYITRSLDSYFKRIFYIFDHTKSRYVLGFANIAFFKRTRSLSSRGYSL